MFDDSRLQMPPDPLHVCPRCGKQAMKEIEQNHFHCFWCGFDRRINSLPADNSIAFIAIFIGVGLALVLLTGG